MSSVTKVTKKTFSALVAKRNSQRRICGGKILFAYSLRREKQCKTLSLWNPQAEQETTVNRCSHERSCFFQVRVRLRGFVQTLKFAFVSVFFAERGNETLNIAKTATLKKAGGKNVLCSLHSNHKPCCTASKFLKTRLSTIAVFNLHSQ